MYIKKLSLVNFKNYTQADFTFSEKINCFIGDNGKGKTNLLDAIYYLSMCKSYFNPVDSQNINHDAEFMVIQADYQRANDHENVYCGMKRNKKKRFKRNNKDYKKLSEHIGLLPVVMVSPNDAVLITGGSDERRKYVDSVISQYDKPYLQHIIKYNRALMQRNQLLKDFAAHRYFDNQNLEVWNIQLLQLGNSIYKKRREFINQLIPIFQKFYNHIAHNNENVSLEYQSQLHQNSFNDLLKNAIQKDRAMQYTTVGVHKDDLLLQLEKLPMKKFGSQGQQKTYLIALKLAQFEFMKEINGMKPILLLDDLFDKLDCNRMQKIIELVSGNNFGQIFITDTDKEHIKNTLLEMQTESKIFDIMEYSH